MLQFHVQLALSEEEILDGLRRAELRRAGKGRLIIQTAVLVLVAAWSMIAFFGGGMTEWMSLAIGLTALVLIPVMWFVPEWQMRSMARSMAENGAAPHLWVFDDGVDFGEQQPQQAYYPFHSFYCDRPTEDAPHQTLVLRFANDDVVVVPKSLLTVEQWNFFVDKTVKSTADKRRHL